MCWRVGCHWLPSLLALKGVSKIYHAQVDSYYEALMHFRCDIKPHEPSAYYKVLLQRDRCEGLEGSLQSEAALGFLEDGDAPVPQEEGVTPAIAQRNNRHTQQEVTVVSELR
jgi:hypothetical protein